MSYVAVSNADVVEIAWTLISLAGLLLARAALADADRDYQLIRAQPKKADRKTYTLECAIVRGDRASARWIIAVEALNMLVGVLAMVQPPPPGGRTVLGWAIIALLMAAGAALPIRLYDQRRRRRRLLA